MAVAVSHLHEKLIPPRWPVTPRRKQRTHQSVGQKIICGPFQPPLGRVMVAAVLVGMFPVPGQGSASQDPVAQALSSRRKETSGGRHSAVLRNYTLAVCGH